MRLEGFVRESEFTMKALLAGFEGILRRYDEF